jgi:hypothetical protein
MSDEELDALFQRGAAAYPDEMPPAAWARMETKLDDAARTQQLRHKVGRFFAAELLLIALLLWQVARVATPTTDLESNHQPVASQAATRTTVAIPTGIALSGSFSKSAVHRDTVAPALGSHTVAVPSFDTTPPPRSNTTLAPRSYTPPVPSAKPRRSPTTATLPSPAASPILATVANATGPTLAPATTSLATFTPARTAKPHRVNAARLAFAKGAVTKEKTAVAILARKKTGGKRPLKQPQVSASAGTHLGGSQAESARAIGLVQVDNFGQQTVEGAGGPVDLLAGRAASLPVVNYTLPAALRQLAVQPPAADTAQPPRHRAPRPLYRVLVGLLAGPNFSGVRTAQTARLGIDYGLTLEYRFNSRLRVRAGLLSSQKRYLAASTDYDVPAAWQWYAGTYDLTASCRVTEIPLDLRYDVLHRPTYVVFTSLGLNSLLMRDERYSYDWSVNGQTFTKSAEVRKGSNHFLSVLNVSVGFEKPLGQRWSAQVEPFWQVPLGGVGAGKIRLTSAGASFSLKFGLLR